VVRLVRPDAIGGDEGAVNDDVVALAETGEGDLKAGGPGGQDVHCLADVAPGSALGYAETSAELAESLVLAQVNQGEQGLLEATEPAPTGVACAAVLVQQPGNMLDELVRHVEHGRIRNQQGLSVAGVLSGITTPTTTGPASSPHPLTSPFHPPAQDERGSVRPRRAWRRSP
jgi:hypothetical protein